ncbi:MAG TPA: hypothetical protein VLO11_07115 [Luteolibacter sp.]|nr:hypothetical protein [Luteolibacter sp.]
MPGIRKFPLRLFLLLGAMSLAASWLLPGSRAERVMLEWCVRGFANPPFIITENDNGWLVRTVNAKPRVDPDHTPLLVSLDDDPEGVFQTSPPSPIDLAVIFSNLHRLGSKHAASAAVLAWDAPDPIGLLALERVLGKFESITMAAPLGRGAVAGTMPPAFRNASIPVSAVRGDAAMLPRVNRMILPDAVLGGDKAWAGFQFLENDIPPRFMPLLARWEDRVVFAFPLLCAIRQQGVALEEIEIHPGEFIRLGADGPVLPVDAHGRLAVPVASGHGMAAIPAATLIEAPDDLLSNREDPFPILRDDRGATEPATHDFSAAFPSIMALIASDAGLASPHAIRRTGVTFDLVLLALCAVCLSAAVRMSEFSQALVFIGIAALLCIAQVAGMAMGHWLPGLPAIAAVPVAVLVARIPWVRRRLDPA